MYGVLDDRARREREGEVRVDDEGHQGGEVDEDGPGGRRGEVEYVGAAARALADRIGSQQHVGIEQVGVVARTALQEVIAFAASEVIVTPTAGLTPGIKVAVAGVLIPQRTFEVTLHKITSPATGM